MIEDVHWADASTRELLDYLARRLTDLPVPDRRHLPDATSSAAGIRSCPILQGWRRSGVADLVELEPLSPEDGIGRCSPRSSGPTPSIGSSSS